MAELDVERSKRMLGLWIVAVLVLVAAAWLVWSVMLDDEEPAVAEPIRPARVGAAQPVRSAAQAPVPVAQAAGMPVAGIIASRAT